MSLVESSIVWIKEEISLANLSSSFIAINVAVLKSVESAKTYPAGTGAAYTASSKM